MAFWHWPEPCLDATWQLPGILAASSPRQRKTYEGLSRSSASDVPVVPESSHGATVVFNVFSCGCSAVGLSTASNASCKSLSRLARIAWQVSRPDTRVQIARRELWKLSRREAKRYGLEQSLSSACQLSYKVLDSGLPKAHHPPRGVKFGCCINDC